MQRDHPSHEVVSHPPGNRPSMKLTLQHVFGTRVARFAQDGVILQINYKKAVKTLHTEAVAAVRAVGVQIRFLGYLLLKCILLRPPCHELTKLHLLGLLC